jgi:hypothetical protein
MLGKILIVVGILLVASGVVLYVLSMPIFTATHTETHTGTTSGQQESEIVMNYAFDLSWPTQQKEVQVQVTTDQTLSIRANGNNNFYIEIVKHQPDNIDAIFLNLGVGTSFSENWNPAQSDTYSLIFHTAGVGSPSDVTINANVNKTWPVAGHSSTVTDTVTEPSQPFINLNLTPRDDYLFIGVSALGCVVFIVGGYANYKASPKKSAQKSLICATT